MGLEVGTMDFERYLKRRQEHECTPFYVYGEQYYKNRNTYIMERKKNIYVDGIGITGNPFGANHKLPSGHFKKIVDQKNNYLLGKGIYFSEEDQKELMNTYFDSSIDETLLDMGTDASKKGEAWLMGYKANDELKFTIIPTEQLTPVYNEFNKLSQMIRRFDDEAFNYANVYTDQLVVMYKKPKSDDEYAVSKVVGHWTEVKEFNGEMIGEPIEHGFGFVPFIPLYNNKERISDLYPIKALIDTYDLINSDFANNIDDMQDAFLTLKGFVGEGKDLGQFMRQLKQYKAVPTPEDGGIESHQSTIPTEARSVFLERLEKDIYKFSMAVDLNNVQGGTLTNVHIKAMFADLDLKCDLFENEVRKFMNKLIDVINFADGKSFTKEYYFERSMIVNRQEAIDGLIKLSGILSQKTIRKLLPYEIDEEQEVEYLDEENGIKLHTESPNDIETDGIENDDTRPV